MAETASRSDKAVGLGVLFGVVSLIGAVVMYVAAADQVTAGWGFALAMLAGGLSVTAIHAFW
jgi:zinc transporter ZupT